MKLESLLLLAGVGLVAYLMLKNRAGAPASAAPAVSAWAQNYNGVNIGWDGVQNLALYYRDGM